MHLTHANELTNERINQTTQLKFTENVTGPRRTLQMYTDLHAPTQLHDDADTAHDAADTDDANADVLTHVGVHQRPLAVIMPLFFVCKSPRTLCLMFQLRYGRQRSVTVADEGKVSLRFLTPFNTH